MIFGQGVIPADSDSDGKLEITTKQNLLYLSQNSEADWTADYVQTTDIVFDASDFEDGGDFYNDGKGFSPIGIDYSNYFTGSYDGQNHTIYGLIINREDQSGAGLFGFVSSSAAISNLGVIDVNITALSSVGALCGRNHGGTINSCYSSGSIQGSFSIGGLCGYNSEGAISNSYSACSVSADMSSSESIGGFCGYNYGSINSSFATGDVSGKRNVGGFCGMNDGGTIENAYATGSVTGENNLGGFCGYIYNAYTFDPTVESYIKNAYSTGEVTAVNSGDDIRIGGFIGSNGYCEISNSFWNTETSGLTVGFDASSEGTTDITGINIVQMQDSTTFTLVSWEFPTIWTQNSTNNNGYPVFSWQDFSNNNTTSISAQERKNEMKIYSSQSRIFLSGKELQMVQVFDLSGKMLMMKKISTSVEASLITVDAPTTGILIVKLYSTNATITEKVYIK